MKRPLSGRITDAWMLSDSHLIAPSFFACYGSVFFLHLNPAGSKPREQLRHKYKNVISYIGIKIKKFQLAIFGISENHTLM